MAKLPKEVRQAWDNRKGAVVLSTVNKAGIPNSIYVTCVSKYDEETLIIANNYFSKTIANIKEGSYGTALFIAGGEDAYQVKGSIEYYTSGPYFEDMKKWNDKEYPGHGATVLKIDEIYKGAEELS